MQDMRDPYAPPAAPFPPHVQRMSEELKQLNERLNKLAQFRASLQYNAIKDIDRKLLEEQQQQMTEYAKTLSLRYFREILAHG